jgi:hypothetical protein
MASRTGSISSNALDVGSKPVDVRASSGSSNCWRSFAKAWLIAGWLSPTAAAARLTWRSAMSASKARSRRKSTERRVWGMRPGKTLPLSCRGMAAGALVTGVLIIRGTNIRMQ